MKIVTCVVENAMVRKCWDFSDLQKASEVPSATLSRVLRGGECRPSTLGRIAKALELMPDELIDRTQGNGGGKDGQCCTHPNG